MMYLELGWVPIIYLIKARCLLYLHYILNESEESMIYRFLQIQLSSPLRGDWALSVKSDLCELKLDQYSFEDIKSLSKEQFRKIVHDAIQREAYKYLIQKKNLQSKIRHIEYQSLAMQPYLKSNYVINSYAKFHFKARSSMLNLRGNFKSQHKESNFCQSCLDETKVESQFHLYHCDTLASSEICEGIVPYDALFGDDLEKQLIVSRILNKRMERRDQLIKSREENQSHSLVGSR